MVSTIIAGAIKCVGYPLAILCLLSLWGKRRMPDKVVLFSIVLLGLLWRVFYFSGHGFSSRYCIVFLLFAIVLAVISLAEVPKTLSILLVATMTVYQLYDAYNDYNKKYIYDTREYLDILANRESAYIMIQEKEYKRLNDSTNKYVLINKDVESEIDFNPILGYYDIRGQNKVYIATSDKRPKEQEMNSRINVVFKCKTGKQKQNYFVIFSIDAQKRNNPSYALDSTENLLLNGNLEEIEEKKVSKTKLNDWIKAGCDFYDNDSLILPKHQYLLMYWNVPQKDDYPRVCLSSKDPIEGSHSLFVEFQDEGLVFLLNKIEKKRGCLSFKIQSLDSETHVTVTEYTYMHDSIIRNRYHIKDLILLDNDIYEISIVIPQRDNNEQQSLFSIVVSNTSFKLDDLAYHYMEDQQSN